tara:strand:- start:2094 stop:3125 length:1032 start_codon:yes stop_codon:yes gene_type:complete
MVASLFGDRFAGRQPAWHRLGEVFPEGEKVTASDGMRRADILFGIDKEPTYTKSGLETGQYAVVREPTSDDPERRVLASVGKEWTAIQAKDLGKMLDPISEKFPVETVGAIGNGEKIFLSMDAGASTIAGEDHELYWLVTDHRDGTGALSIAFTPVRVVCQNTLITGLRSAKVSVSLKHNKSIQTDASFYLDIFNQMAKTQENVVNAMNSMTKSTLNERQVQSVMTSAYPTASKPTRLKLSANITADDVPSNVWQRILNDKKEQKEEWEKRQSRVDKVKDGAMERLDVFNQEFPNLANTPWAVYNAIVETEDYRRGHDKSGTALFGGRAEAKARAFNKALDLA